MKPARLISLLFLAVFFCPFGECTAAVVHGPKIDPRDMAIDRQVGGMEEGSRIAHPHHDAGEQQAHEKVRGNESGVGTEAHATAASGAHNLSPSQGVPSNAGANSGASHLTGSAASVSSHAETGIGASHAATSGGGQAGIGANGIGAGGTAGNGQGQTGQTEAGQVEAGGNQAAQEANHGVFVGGNTGAGGGETTTSETANASVGANAGSSTSGSETATAGSESSRHIVETDTNVNLSGETPSASGNVSVDTNAGGGLLGANTATNTGPATQQTNAEVGQGTAAGGGFIQQLISEVSQPITGGSSSSGLGTQTTSGESSTRSIIEADTNANLSGENPNVNANVSVDTNANGGLLDANTATNAGTVAENQTTQTENHGILVGGNTGAGGGETTDRSIIEADTNANLSGENPNANTNVSADTNANGGLLDANTATNAGSAEQQITSPLGQETSTGNTGSGETAGNGDSHHIIEADANLTGNPSLDVTVDTSAGGGLLDAHADTGAGTVNQQLLSESSHETSSTSTGNTSSGTTSSGSTNHSIIEADTNVNLNGGTPTADANVSIDPNASGGLVDLDTATNADTAEQELTSSAGLEIGLGADTIAGESELGTEIGIGSDAPPAGEAETGLEADVEGIGATEDTASDPADGLSTTSVPHL